MANYNLQQYIRVFLKKKLHKKFDVDDLAQECNLAILQSEKLSAQLRHYLESNTIPKGMDLSLLKAILYRQRLKYIEKETRYPVERLMFEENLSQEEHYDRRSQK